MNGYGMTDMGLKRQNNEDAIWVSNEPVGPLPNLYIVSDGMGGHSAGEVASRRGIDFFCEALRSAGPAFQDGCAAEGLDILDILVGAINVTNTKVFNLSRQTESFHGMGATFLACVLAGGKIYAAHVGDSRAYVALEGELSQITSDHSLVNEMLKAGEITKEEAKTHPRRNVITRALGTAETVNIDGVVLNVQGSGILLLCTDGLSNMVPDGEILAVLNGEGTVPEKCERLIEMAKKYGGDDNISVVLVPINEVIV